jgi:hypothetical protein
LICHRIVGIRRAEKKTPQCGVFPPRLLRIRPAAQYGIQAGVSDMRKRNPRPSAKIKASHSGDAFILLGMKGFEGSCPPPVAEEGHDPGFCHMARRCSAGCKPKTHHVQKESPALRQSKRHRKGVFCFGNDMNPCGIRGIPLRVCNMCFTRDMSLDVRGS